MGNVCSKEGCTFADTGICLQNISPPETCPELVGAENSVIADVKRDTEKSIEANRVAQNFPSGHVMNLADVSNLTSKEYTRMIGILGAPNAGKTAALVSLYLMLANDKLEGFSYRDSKSLLALEEISRGARRWSSGSQPEQLTTHTRSLDDRQPGFVHLRVHRSADQHTVALVMPDLPGEWTKTFVDGNTFKRLSFLDACEVIWIVIDGRDVRDRLGRRREINRTELLLQRLKQNLQDSEGHEIVFVVTHADRGDLGDDTLKPVSELAEKLGFRHSVHHIASFSESDAVAPGTGVAKLLSATLNDSSSASPEIWPERGRGKTRHMMRFRQTGGHI